MQTQQPPAPPPYSPPPEGGSNPYDFFLNNNPTPKKRLSVGGGKSVKQRILIIVGGGAFLLTIIIISFSLLFGGTDKSTSQFISLAQQQTEIMRIADIGITKARDNSGKNLAINVKLSFTTAKLQTTDILKKHGAKVGEKELAAKKNSQNDQALEAAAVNNSFDVTFTKIIGESLAAYQADLKKTYDITTSKTEKQFLEGNYKSVGFLVGGQTAQTN